MVAVKQKKSNKKLSKISGKKNVDKLCVKNSQDGDVDNKFYQVERIVSNKINDRELVYKIKWQDWKGSCTWEPENRLYCSQKLIEFAAKLLKAKFASNSNCINKHLQDINLAFSDKEFCRKIVDPMSITAQTAVLGGTTKFVTMDTIGSKVMYLKYIIDHDQQYVLHSLQFPSFFRINNDFKRYRKELNYRQQIFEEYPFVKFIFPVRPRNVFYSPPPLSNLLFEPVTERMLENREDYIHFFPPRSSDRVFNNVQALIKAEYFEKEANRQPWLLMQKEHSSRIFYGMKRIRYRKNSRFGVSFELRQESGIGWTLTTPMNINAGVPLMMMCGVIRPSSTAHQSLVTEGEQVAFGSFIEIPGTGMCLDRREFYDFSKYIPHSCNPTCDVRLVESGNEIPDLVLHSRVPICKKNDNAITLDYFRSFTKCVKKHFSNKRFPDGKMFSLYEDGIDFIKCHCENKCREILYIDKSTIKTHKNSTKLEKLSSLDPKFMFTGMRLVQSSKIWKISEQRFVD